MVVHLLHRVGGQHDHVEIAVAAAFAGLEIVALRRLDRTQARAAALAIDDQAGQLGARQVAQPLGHQADAGAGRGGHHPFSGRCAAVDHVDRRDLRLGLQNDHARGLPRFEFHEGFHHLRLRSDGVSEISVATVANGRMGDHFVAFHQFHFILCHSLLEFLTINRNAAIRTNHRTGGTARAGIGIDHPRNGITFAVDLRRQREHVARTGRSTDPAPLAALLVDNDCSFDFCHNA
jgi:hypothetical protein